MTSQLPQSAHLLKMFLLVVIETFFLPIELVKFLPFQDWLKCHFLWENPPGCVSSLSSSSSDTLDLPRDIYTILPRVTAMFTLARAIHLLSSLLRKALRAGIMPQPSLWSQVPSATLQGFRLPRGQLHSWVKKEVPICHLWLVPVPLSFLRYLQCFFPGVHRNHY